MNIKRIFKLIEYTLSNKQMPMEKLRRSEKAVPVLSSQNFVDPADTVADEAKRLEDRPVSPGASNLFY